MNVCQVIPQDAIPSVDDPSFGATYDGDADDVVVVVEGPRRPRAYPVRYLHYHEIVNDVLDADGETGGGDPIAVTWCPLCGSAVVYDRRHEGHTLEFGVSGKLADDDLVMYDRETGSEWKQSSGECINGTFEGDSLAVRPGTLLPWQEFRKSYPDGIVLQPPGGESEAASADDSPASIEYDTSPYDAYFSREGFGLAAHRGTGTSREWNRDDDLSPKTVVLGIEVDDVVLGFPLTRVRAAGGVVQTTVGDRDIVVFATEDDGIHGFEDPGISFEFTENQVVADGTTWNPATGRAADGRQLERLSARRLFAFAWQDDHGADSFYQPG
ncbi:DUF3179 domain-containing protein [Halorarius halobius]|uniref:DUF3179 domain-containing protein n=1 Tax=Halorarius halobius TaxID=2962671 RepID=UPI0020CFBDBA|nr:DUF3179 domain-containing protein [Halorarius halobius]